VANFKYPKKIKTGSNLAQDVRSIIATTHDKLLARLKGNKGPNCCRFAWELRKAESLNPMIRLKLKLFHLVIENLLHDLQIRRQKTQTFYVTRMFS